MDGMKEEVAGKIWEKLMKNGSPMDRRHNLKTGERDHGGGRMIAVPNNKEQYHKMAVVEAVGKKHLGMKAIQVLRQRPTSTHTQLANNVVVVSDKIGWSNVLVAKFSCMLNARPSTRFVAHAYLL